MEDPAQQLDLRLCDEAGSQRAAEHQRPLAVNDGMRHLLQRIDAKLARRRSCLFQHMHQQFELGPAVDHAIARDRADQPVGIVLRDIARRLFLVDDIVGNRLHEEGRPFLAFVLRRCIERKQRLGLAARHDAIAEHFMAQHRHVLRGDAAFRGQPGHRRAHDQFAHLSSPSAVAKRRPQASYKPTYQQCLEKPANGVVSEDLSANACRPKTCRGFEEWHARALDVADR